MGANVFIRTHKVLKGSKAFKNWRKPLGRE